MDEEIRDIHALLDILIRVRDLSDQLLEELDILLEDMDKTIFISNIAVRYENIEALRAAAENMEKIYNYMRKFFRPHVRDLRYMSHTSLDKFDDLRAKIMKLIGTQ